MHNITLDPLKSITKLTSKLTYDSTQACLDQLLDKFL